MIVTGGTIETDERSQLPGYSWPTRWSRPHWRILCYHTVPDDLVSAFRAQLVAFGAMGFTFIGLDQGLEICRKERFTRPTMTVTFDDGDLTVYRNALPILEELNIPAFLYLTADYVNKGKNYQSRNPLPIMTWDHAREWVRSGQGVGSHALTHVALRGCSESHLMHECTRSKQILEENLQVPIRHFSYPYGQHSGRTYRLLSEGRLYDSAATIDRGRMRAGHDLYRLRRDVCHPQWPLASVVRTMRLADWCYWLRYVRRYFQTYLHKRRCRATG
jgi:peptidoglycan/xylan/chitin deacetylase (PgdA/CDA1 family)